jgi:hypothetical protein
MIDHLVIEDLTRWSIIGAVFLAPVTLIVLPLAYLVMRPLNRPMLLALVGAVAAIAVIILELALGRALGSPIDSIVEVLLNANYVGPRVLGGVVAALAFAYIMRWWLPAQPMEKVG